MNFDLLQLMYLTLLLFCTSFLSFYIIRSMKNSNFKDKVVTFKSLINKYFEYQKKLIVEYYQSFQKYEIWRFYRPHSLSVQFI